MSPSLRVRDRIYYDKPVVFAAGIGGWWVAMNGVGRWFRTWTIAIQRALEASKRGYV